MSYPVSHFNECENLWDGTRNWRPHTGDNYHFLKYSLLPFLILIHFFLVNISDATNLEYRDLFGITKDRMLNLKKELVIMHPGPINRGVEIDSYVADSDQSIILNQVLNGVAVRMSILYLLLGASE